jgi:hypothetical protein
MSLSPEQQRKKAMAMEESLRHQRYSQVDRERSAPMESPPNSAAIEKAGKRVMSAMEKEEADIGGKNASPNDDRY